ncbi:hypothetical protein GCM10010394_45190 [Streptomyces crystallinus]|uniref:Uncharacterized protein n=1 Tax=Streptomyces crystallinus TaxID=68191 RepID=A0ABN1GF74_9ACTN
MRTEASSGTSSRRSAADGSVKPNRSSRVKVLLLRPGAAVIPPPNVKAEPIRRAPPRGRREGRERPVAVRGRALAAAASGA